MTLKINPRPADFPFMREAAEKIALLSGVMPPALKIEGIEATEAQLFTRTDPAQDALDALLRNDVEATRKHLREMAIDKVRERKVEEDARKITVHKAKEIVLSEDFPLLLEYINSNLEKARQGFNENAKIINKEWRLEPEAQSPAFNAALDLADKGIELQDILRKFFQLKNPKHAHPFTVGTMRPFEDPNDYHQIDVRPTRIKFIETMDDRAKPGDTIKLHWKSAREFEAESKVYEAMLQELGDAVMEDIPVYEYWLNKKK